MTNTTLEFMVTTEGVPALKIQKPDNEYRSGFNQGYMSVFRNYNVQISRSEQGDMCLGHSYPRPRDFDYLNRETLIRHIKECLDDNQKTVYDFNFNFEDIPNDILETFIEASIDASHHWDEIFRSGYKVSVSAK